MQKAIRLIVILSMVVALVVIFFFAPEERVMGVVQKIFYFHLASAWTGFLAFFVVFIVSIMYLITNKAKYDKLAQGSAELGVLFITIVLITGSIWGKAAWGSFWTWEPKLTTTLIVWFFYVTYLMLRDLTMDSAIFSKIASIFGIIGFINIPLVYYSVEWWGRKLHPPSMMENGLPPEMVITLMITVISFSFVYLYFLNKSYKIMELKEKVIIKKREAINLIDLG